MIVFSVLLFLYGLACVIGYLLSGELLVLTAFIPFLGGLIGIAIWLLKKHGNKRVEKIERQERINVIDKEKRIEELSVKAKELIRQNFKGYFESVSGLIEDLPLKVNGSPQKENIFARCYMPVKTEADTKVVRFIFSNEKSEDGAEINSIIVECSKFKNKEAQSNEIVEKYSSAFESYGYTLAIDTLNNCPYFSVKENSKDREFAEFLEKSINKLKELLIDKTFVKFISLTKNFI